MGDPAFLPVGSLFDHSITLACRLEILKSADRYEI